MVFSNLGLPPGGIDVPVVNVSTGAITKFMVVVGGVRTLHTTTGQVDPADGKLIYPAAPSTVAKHSEVLGVAIEAIGANGGVGQVRIFGPTFIRVGTQTLGANDTAETAALIGTVTNTTGGGAAFFYAALAASQTFTFGSQQITFSTAHAYGFVNTIPLFRFR